MDKKKILIIVAVVAVLAVGAFLIFGGGNKTASTRAFLQSFPKRTPTSSKANIGLSIYNGTASRCEAAGIRQARVNNTASKAVSRTIQFDFKVITILVLRIMELQIYNLILKHKNQRINVTVPVPFLTYP